MITSYLDRLDAGGPLQLEFQSAQHILELETHIFHFDGDLYGQPLTVSFVGRLRAERKFESREALAAQLAADARQAEILLNC